MPSKPRFLSLSVGKSCLILCSAIILGYALFASLYFSFVPRLRSGPGPGMEELHKIGLAMFSYANDHGGKYPEGKSSTEAFQKLVDGGYVTDPSIFYSKYLHDAGKTKATSKQLKPENVCFDVTVPANTSDLDGALPIAFITGYKLNYVPGGDATPTQKPSSDSVSPFWVYYINNSASLLTSNGRSDGVIPNVIPAQANAKGVKYIQLTPDGPLL
jgi:hypothetical protein